MSGLEAVLEAASLGWAVVPITPGAKQPPLIKNWPNAASSDAELIKDWWRQWPDANFGVVCGASEVVVLDQDGEAGFASLEALEAELGPLPDTLTVETKRGEHRYFRDPGSITRQTSWRPGVDVLADRSCAVGPGSIVDGHAYTPVDVESLCEARICDLPDRWIEALRAGCTPLDTIAPTPNGLNGVLGGNGVHGVDGVNGVQQIVDLGEVVRDILRRYQITERGMSYRQIWNITRHLRSQFPNQVKPPDELLTAIRRWWEAGRSHTERSWGDTCASFMGGWEAVQLGPDAPGALAEALRAADARDCPAALAQKFPDTEDEPLRRLAKLMIELQRRAGEEPFWLAQAEAGLVLGISRDRTGRWMRMFRRLSWIKLVRQGSFAEHRANEYRWIGPIE